MYKNFTSRLNFYWQFINHHMQAGHTLYVLVAWHLQRIQKLLGVGFATKSGRDSENIDLYLTTISKDFPTLGPVIEAAKKHTGR